MSLRLALLTNYPLVDNVRWKRDFVLNCKTNGFDIDVYYGKKDIKSLLFSYLKKRKYSNSVAKRIQGNSIKNKLYFKKNGHNVNSFKNLNSEKAISRIQEGNYDIIITALDQILSKNFITKVNTKIVNVHYGMLPEIKGTSALEWTYFCYNKCEITLHYIDAGIDTGVIIDRKEITVAMPISFSKLRGEVQKHIPNIINNFLIKIEKNESLNTFANDQGDLYTFMHQDLVEIIEKRNESLYNT
ncbi:formyltransferase family protein [Winogradskyella forsetii]|uniref:formyltransferase family protein n=1 Tax=Winogradskyella forsetii TaxID=2686077 RepID=UPI0015C01841|nr:formyltransferase family protein [Winogradskyella forsetii]